jgi:hypothetical protein
MAIGHPKMVKSPVKFGLSNPYFRRDPFVGKPMQAIPSVGSNRELAEHAKSDAFRSRDGRWVFELSMDAWSHLQLADAQGQIYRDVVVLPLFPVATPREWISIVSCEGEELVCLRDVSALSPFNRERVEYELAYREFVPQILRVLWVSGTQEPCEWEVETNFGKTRFVLNSEEDVRRVSAWTVHFVDASGGRFRVDDLRKLDSRSRASVEWYV